MCDKYCEIGLVVGLILFNYHCFDIAWNSQVVIAYRPTYNYDCTRAHADLQISSLIFLNCLVWLKFFKEFKEKLRYFFIYTSSDFFAVFSPAKPTFYNV